jgi:outer membrane protein OmpA-like peptidoglycan-associated protein
MPKSCALILIVLLTLMTGCLEQTRSIHMRTIDGMSDVEEFPSQGAFGLASAYQVRSLAELVAQSHDLQMEGIAATEDRSREALDILRDLSKSQGLGEITLFFQTGSSAIGNRNHERLVEYLDYIGREWRGRKVYFVLIGSASATGSESVNARLAAARAEAPRAVINRYLVNIPHEIHQTYTLTGQSEPSGAARRNVRIVAAFETEQLPDAP